VSPTQLPKKGGSASRRDASSSSANLIARLRGRVFLFVFLVGEGKKPVSQWRGASLSQKLRRLSKWFPGLYRDISPGFSATAFTWIPRP
jgi:hypothetical protein